MVTSGKLRFHKLRDQKTNNFNSFVWLNDGRKYCNRPLTDLISAKCRRMASVSSLCCISCGRRLGTRNAGRILILRTFVQFCTILQLAPTNFRMQFCIRHRGHLSSVTQKLRLCLSDTFSIAASSLGPGRGSSSSTGCLFKI